MQLSLADIKPDIPEVLPEQVMDCLADDLLNALLEMESLGHEPVNLSEKVIVLDLSPFHPTARFDGLTYRTPPTEPSWPTIALRRWAAIMTFTHTRLGTWGQRPAHMQSCVQACQNGEFTTASEAIARMQAEGIQHTPIVPPTKKSAPAPLDVRLGAVLVRQPRWRFASWGIGAAMGIILGTTVATKLAEHL